MNLLLAQAPAEVSTKPLLVLAIYLGLLLALALFSGRLFRGTSKDYFVASHSIGPFMLLMSVFGTTMTAFALVGSTGKAFQQGVGTYGLMASSSGLVHAACFFLIGIRVWAIAKREGYVTQIQFFRGRFESNGLGYLLFPILVLLVIPYLLIGVIGSYRVIGPLSKGMYPELFAATDGSIPSWIIGIVICGVVLTYIFAGGSRAAAWANTFQTLVFMAMGVLAFYLLSDKLGGLGAAIAQANPQHLVRTPSELEIVGQAGTSIREVGFPYITFFTYMFIPLSVGMFPHLFQHWLTAKSAKSFKLTVIAHPICIAIVWVPCVLIGLWATGVFNATPSEAWPAAAVGIMKGLPDSSVGAVLSLTLRFLVENPIIVGLVTAGILAAIMSSLDSQFLCLGTIFTNDVVLHKVGRDRFTDKQIVLIARGFVVAVVLLTYGLSLYLEKQQNVFDLAIWSFSGFSALTSLVIGALYWKGATKAGAYACVLAVAVSWLYFFLKSGGHEYTVAGVMPVAICFVVGAVSLIVVSLFTKKPSDETIRKFFP
ncbi:MAG: sodium:solute symporter family protein [Verrucomicrobiales bacterium]|jgi:SSS family solute:Na+ symporter|nr:sodium:solute symporter family protein [Verrucomicrobiales bacterium]